MRTLPILCLLIVAALLPATAAAAVPPPLTADFTITPGAPRPGETVTFTSTSFAPSGGFIATDWDLDGDGDFDDGRKPSVTRTFDAGTHTVRLQATLAGPAPRVEVAAKTFTVSAEPTPTATATPTAAATPEPAATPTATPIPTTRVGCRETVTKGLFFARSECFTHSTLRVGTKTRDQYRSYDPVTANGVTITPAPGKPVLITMLDGKQVAFGTHRGTATVRTITVGDGRIWWTFDGKKLTGVEPSGTIGQLPVTKADAELNLGAGSTWAFTVRMPAQFGSPTSDKPIVVTTGGLKASAAQNSAAFHFEVEHAVLGPIGLNKLVLDYDGQSSWLIKADATLPPPIDGRLKASAGIRDGAFEHAGADLTFDDPGMSIVGPVFLKRIAFRVEFSPKRSECVPHIGVVDRSGPLGGGIVYPPGIPQVPTRKDYGVPTFALCGEVGLVAGGTILGRPVIGLDAGLGFALFDDRPAILRAFGEVSLVGLPLYDGALEMHSDGYIELDAHAKWIWPGVALLDGKLGVEMLGTKFNAHGRVEACIDEIDWCVASARAVASNAGVAVCLDIAGWEPGLGYKWGETPTIYFAGCELGPYKTRVAHAAQAGPRTVTLPAGLPGAAIAIVGRDGAPDVTLVGPKGERIATTTTGRVGDALILKSAKERLTQIAIAKPSAGAWRIESGAAIEKVMSAQGLERPTIKAKVSRGKLRYEIDARPGQKVTFAERGASAGAIIGVAKGAKGALAFDPADGKAERRQIVAIVEQDGLPSTQLAVASYRAPKAAKPAKARGVRLVRRGTRVTVRWTGDAPAHIVTLELSDGRRLVQRVDGRRRLTRTGIARGVKATASVRAIGRNGMLASAVKAR